MVNKAQRVIDEPFRRVAHRASIVRTSQFTAFENAMATAVHPTGKLGPNAIIQTVAALEEALGVERARAALVRGGAGDLPDHLPQALIDEHEFHELVMLLIDQLGGDATIDILARSGQLTAEYVFANRIPAIVRAILRILPPQLGLKILLPAMQRHTWTFAGSGSFAYHSGVMPWLEVANPAVRDDRALAGALCAYYRGAFAQMLRMLIDPRARLRDCECQARGDRRCRYAIEW